MDGSGSLRARLRGALDLDLHWRDAEMRCESGLRPDGSGLRFSLGGPLRRDGRRIRIVLGIGDAMPGIDAQARPANVTIIFEGEQRVFATRGDDKCTVDRLHQQPMLTGPGTASAQPPQAVRRWRVSASGFCVAPATSIDRTARILLSRFDLVTELRIAP
ncbi:MAG: hypothetical protein NZM12_05440 [Steroidobacteraceae bacterium]|nr:hypothetical protein [Steroidobacteraceae bacterium]MDW8260821.1 hypothetical protein [Gammaproteobacteria bacterium]